MITLDLLVATETIVIQMTWPSQSAVEVSKLVCARWYFYKSITCLSLMPTIHGQFHRVSVHVGRSKKPEIF